MLFIFNYILSIKYVYLYILKLYSFTSPYLSDRFHLDTETGVVTVAGSLLADAGHVFHCEIEARDKGHPPRIARGKLKS